MASQKQLEAWFRELTKLFDKVIGQREGGPVGYWDLPGSEDILLFREGPELIHQKKMFTRKDIDQLAALIRSWEPIEKLKAFKKGAYGAHGDIGDLYDENAEALKVAIEKKGPFTTGWFSAKKEIESANVTREIRNGPILVEVSQCMDEGHDLIDTLIWDAAGGNKFAGSGYDALEKILERGTDIQLAMDEILGKLSNIGIINSGDNCESDAGKLPPEATFDEVVAKMEVLVEGVGEDLDENYQEAILSVREMLGLGPREWSPRRKKGLKGKP